MFEKYINLIIMQFEAGRYADFGAYQISALEWVCFSIFVISAL